MNQREKADLVAWLTRSTTASREIGQQILGTFMRSMMTAGQQGGGGMLRSLKLACLSVARTKPVNAADLTFVIWPAAHALARDGAATSLRELRRSPGSQAIGLSDVVEALNRAPLFHRASGELREAFTALLGGTPSGADDIEWGIAYLLISELQRPSPTRGRKSFGNAGALSSRASGVPFMPPS